MLLDPLSHKRTVVSGLNTARYNSVASSGEEAGYTFHGHAALQRALGRVRSAGLHAQFGTFAVVHTQCPNGLR